MKKWEEERKRKIHVQKLREAKPRVNTNQGS